ncbi:aminopeptidase [Collinsella sp. An7]|uniref:aminopeptidase n=1 Tax=Collinsella sp. An7 TaxID=1965651 RepID=UPI000B3AD0CC|nr:aminopeptidase [Collinsella sp. An7]OUN46985.1 aminopeptidase [Collinsella sp. An7]
MERPNAWKAYDDAALAELEELCQDYRAFISQNKTERECVTASVKLAEAAGYVSLDAARAQGRELKAGDKVYATCHNKTLMLVNLGTAPLEDGLNILGAHIDSPRLDLKQNPLYEAGDMAYLDTHYYGGVKAYHWVATPLAIHGVVCKKDGTTVEVAVGEDADDPVFCISDLLIHLAADQMKKPAAEAVDHENLDVIVGGRPVVIDEQKEDDPKEPVKRYLLGILKEKYGFDEEDFLSAEIEVVPAGPAREMGFDRSMILGYGQDDRVCAYTSLAAQLAVPEVERTAVTLLVDKEEIGSVGASGMTSRFFENTMAEVLALAGLESPLALRRCLGNSRMLSSDVSAGFDQLYADRFEKKNAAIMGHGLCFNKYTGSRGKSGSNDADAEYVALVRDIMDEAGVAFQTCELGRIGAGGGGTIAFILAEYGMDVIDSGVAVLSMHSLWEVTNKADVYEAYKGYQAFIKRA